MPALTQRPVPSVAEVKWPKFKVTTPSREAFMNASSYTFISPYFIDWRTGKCLPLSSLGFKGTVTGISSLPLIFYEYKYKSYLFYTARTNGILEEPANTVVCFKRVCGRLLVIRFRTVEGLAIK